MDARHARPSAVRDLYRVRRAILIGGSVGCIDGLLVLIVPTLAVVLIVLILIAPPRPAVAGGVLIGLGIGMSIPLWLESVKCAADSGCLGPDIGGWLIASLVSVMVGLVLARVAGRRSGDIAS